jgi:hypothetical protein
VLTPLKTSKSERNLSNMEVNGLVEMNRDVVLRLVKIIDDPEKIRMLFGICVKVYEWKSHSYFLKIRRESIRSYLGSVAYFPTLKKIEMCDKFKATFMENFFYPPSAASGALKPLFELFPISISKNADNNFQEKKLLSSLLDLFFLVIRKDFDFQKHFRRIFFEENKKKQKNLLDWLFVLFKRYEDSLAKEKIAIILFSFHSHSGLPKRMEVLLRTMMTLPSAHAKISVMRNSKLSATWLVMKVIESF